MKIIHVELSEEYTNLTVGDNITELDCILGISAIFDRLSVKTKKLLVKKLKEVQNEKTGALMK